MRPILFAVILALLATTEVTAQRRKPQPKRPAPAETSKPPASRMIGSAVTVTTKNGDNIKGQLVDISAFSITIQAGNLESTMALETIASISVGSAPQPALQQV